MPELVKCSRCHSEIESKYFSTNRKGIRQKCCDNCLAKYQCDHCEYTCSTQGNMKKHIDVVHLKLTPYACPHCDMTFGHNSNLQKHINTVHLKLKPYSCPTCDMTFGHNSNLQNHIQNVHLKLTPYSCPHCYKKFGDNGHMKRHIQTVHMKLKPYSCPTCYKKFGQNDNLQNHINIVHLKQKNYACTQCDAKFGRNGDLQNHIKICTGKFTGSAGEYKIIQLLDELGLEKEIDYIYDQTYWDVKDKGLLKWDCILRHKEHNPMVIEYDGVAHFLPTRFGGISQEKAQENLVTAQHRDKIKDDHCTENNIPILRIPYWDFDNIETLVMEFIAVN
jgi:uncharacterized C2H2 Zn-finger protein